MEWKHVGKMDKKEKVKGQQMGQNARLLDCEPDCLCGGLGHRLVPGAAQRRLVPFRAVHPPELVAIVLQAQDRRPRQLRDLQPLQDACDGVIVNRLPAQVQQTIMACGTGVRAASMVVGTHG